MSHVAIAAHMMVLKEYGGVTAVLVGNTRKSMTIALSFFLFPKVGLLKDSATTQGALILPEARPPAHVSFFSVYYYFFFY